MPYFYLARCSDGSLYAGSCMDLQSREARHNSGKGAKYTRSRLPITFVYSEKCETLSQAFKREAEVKTWAKEQKEELVRKKNGRIQQRQADTRHPRERGKVTVKN
ncbi:MAG: GIY-YIG nuclease family protein [Candidatus Peregrinibacteria bacterium]